MRAVINTTKHIVQSSLGTITAGNKTTVTVINSVAVSDKDAANEVQEGAIVSSVKMEYWIATNDASAGTNVVIVEKVPTGTSGATAADMALLQNYKNKKNILFTHQGLTNVALGVAMPLQIGKDGWLKIPKGKQRFGLGDSLKITFFTQTGTLKFCGFSLYKEQT